MSRVKVCLVALALAAVLPAGPALAADDAWTLKTAVGRLAFHPELANDLGIQAGANAPADKHGRKVITFEAAGRLELRGQGSIFRDVGAGELRLASTGTLRLGTTDVLFDGVTVQRGLEDRTLSIVANDGRILFWADHMHHLLDVETGRIRLFNLDLRLAPEAARALGDERYADMAVAVLELEGPVTIPPAPDDPSGCTTPNWGLPDNDTSMLNIGTVQQMATEAATGRIAVAPSSTVGNVGVTDVPWYEKFSGNFPPYNNDQHPFLIWNMYRLANGVMEQIGISPLKHAFTTINQGCSCPDPHVLGVGCNDTYGTINNDSIFDLTLRPEVTAFTGVWKRCGSIFDPDCNNVENSPPPRSGPMDRRMAVATADFGVPGAVYYLDSWYIVRDDTNIFNQGWRTLAPHPIGGGNWGFDPLGPMNIGVVIDQWVNPANPGPNAQSVAINTSLGRLRMVVKAFDLGGGLWRYEYGLVNYDFDPRIKSFTVPLPAGVNVTNPGFHDPDQDAGNNWTASVSPNGITFQAPSAAATQDYGSLFNFRFTVNAAPTAAGGTVVSMRAQEVRMSVTGAIVGPGTPTQPDR